MLYRSIIVISVQLMLFCTIFIKCSYVTPTYLNGVIDCHENGVLSSDDTCIIDCAYASVPTTSDFANVRCGNAGMCIINCNQDDCFKDSYLDASNVTNYLHINGTFTKCFDSAFIDLPSNTNSSTYIFADAHSALNKLNINGGNGSLEIMCANNDANDDNIDVCKAMQIHASHAKYLKFTIINTVADESKTQQPLIECPSSDSDNEAVCVINATTAISTKGMRIFAKNGSPNNVIFYAGNDGEYTDTTITCDDGTSVIKDNSFVGIGDCWNTHSPTSFLTPSPTTNNAEMSSTLFLGIYHPTLNDSGPESEIGHTSTTSISSSSEHSNNEKDANVKKDINSVIDTNNLLTWILISLVMLGLSLIVLFMCVILKSIIGGNKKHRSSITNAIHNTMKTGNGEESTVAIDLDMINENKKVVSADITGILDLQRNQLYNHNNLATHQPPPASVSMRIAQIQANHRNNYMGNGAMMRVNDYSFDSTTNVEYQSSDGFGNDVPALPDHGRDSESSESSFEYKMKLNAQNEIISNELLNRRIFSQRTDQGNDSSASKSSTGERDIVIGTLTNTGRFNI